MTHWWTEKKKFKIFLYSGVAKDFEIVQKVRNVVALEDEFDSESLLEYQWEDDDEWEQIYDEQLHPTEKRSYSSVLKGLNETRTWLLLSTWTTRIDLLAINFRRLNDRWSERKGLKPLKACYVVFASHFTALLACSQQTWPTFFAVPMFKTVSALPSS